MAKTARTREVMRRARSRGLVRFDLSKKAYINLANGEEIPDGRIGYYMMKHFPAVYREVLDGAA